MYDLFGYGLFILDVNGNEVHTQNDFHYGRIDVLTDV